MTRGNQRLVAAIMCATSFVSAMAADAAEDAPSGYDWTHAAMLQFMQDNVRYGSDFGSSADHTLNAEARIDVAGRCTESWCQGVSAMLKPRVRYFASSDPNPYVVQPKRFLWNEAYLTGTTGWGATWLAGKRYLAWGPGLLFSPSNRLFPDNGNATPRREIAGKPLVTISANVSSRLALSGVYADPYLEPVPGIDERGALGLLRAEYTGGGSRPTTAGMVVGGGGGYRPYIGAYMQHLLSDAWTVGAEMSASRGYASRSDGGPQLQQSRDRLMADALVNLRYGLPSGGEIGVEALYNGYRLSSAEMAVARLSAQPAGGLWQTRNRPLHPLPEGRYMLLQMLTPGIFGNRKFGMVARSLFELSTPANQTFVELSYSPRDNLTAYLGALHTSGSSRSELTRTMDDEVYVTLEFFL